MSDGVTYMPNPSTDALRRFFVVAVEHKPDKGRPWVSTFLVRDRCGFAPDIPFPVTMPEGDRRRRPSTDAEDAARTAAEQHRRDLNLCELNGHNFAASDHDHCTQCGGRP